MRTTLTIDDQLVAELKQRAFETGKSFKSVVNEVLRNGLQDKTASKSASQNYSSPTISMGQHSVDITKAVVLAGELEDEELLRKLELRK